MSQRARPLVPFGLVLISLLHAAAIALARPVLRDVSSEASLASSSCSADTSACSVGIGIGLALGAAALLAFWYFYHRRKVRQLRDKHSGELGTRDAAHKEELQRFQQEVEDTKVDVARHLIRGNKDFVRGKQ
ncbi:hypothetical protein Q5752_003359 [Cryptotrichosporon argae]